jgi:hypothetical protein
MLTLYPKPTRFSDPFQEWEGCEETLDNILSTEKGDLGLSDYDTIFYLITPAANYEEGAYYIDGCFDFMRRKLSRIESNICEGLFYFINYHRERLKEDGLLSQCLEEIINLFQCYTASFELMRLTDGELEQYGTDPTYRELARYYLSIWSLIDYLIGYELYSSVLDSSLTWLDQDDVHKSCWWIEIADHVRVWYVIYNAVDESNSRKQRLMDRLLKLHDYSFHMHRQSDFVRQTEYMQYWERLSVL